MEAHRIESRLARMVMSWMDTNRALAGAPASTCSRAFRFGQLYIVLTWCLLAHIEMATTRMPSLHVMFEIALMKNTLTIEC
jgi:hypothetical protein